MRLITLFILASMVLISCEIDWAQNKNHSHDHVRADYRPDDNIQNMLIDHNSLDSHFKESMSSAKWNDADQDQHMYGDDVVIGILVNQVPYAIPWWIHKNHHIANLTIEGVPLVITLCEMCSGASAYVRRMDTTDLVFFQKGLYKGSWFMEDYETGTYWLPFEGVGFYGALKDRELQFVQTFQGTWSEWKEQYPDTKVMHGVPSMRTGHGSREFPGRKFIEEVFAETLLEEIDTSLQMYDLVMGVRNDTLARAYAISELDKLGSVVMDTFPDGSRIVVFHNPQSLLSGAYYASLDDVDLSFHEVNGIIKDKESASSWNLSGSAYDGEYKGQKLEPLFFVVKEWYGWHEYYPHTDVYGK